MLEVEAAHAGVEGSQGLVVALVVVSQLGGDEQLSARQPTVAKGGGDVPLVVVDARGVDMAIVQRQGCAHRTAGLFAAGGQVEAKADLGQVDAVVQENGRMRAIDTCTPATRAILRRR